jgi:protein-L-isoaspartate(D-aspartate) O-methyltransferase
VDFERARQLLVSSIRSEIKDVHVLEALLRVPRELFVPPELQSSAYDDRPLNIGHGQTISQPFMVALMTEALELGEEDRVQEIGTGSGYQTAVLAEIAGFVFSTERIPLLAETATALLKSLGYTNIQVKISGEDLGWEENAPYDAIVVTAAAPSISDGILDQLRVGGRLVIPVGSKWEQDLLKVTKGQHGNDIKNLGAVRFVPLIGKDAWAE